jgi:biotin-dependent carboxylase-like uncharacterized protein
MKGFDVLKPGTLTLIQDLGRRGFQHLGLTCGGSLDDKAARWANRLLANAVSAALLEISLGGLVLRCGVSSRIALTGADLGLRINGTRCPAWRSYRVMPGDRLEFGYARTGLRGYLAVAGGFVLDPSFGSCSTVVREAVGGLNGGALVAGDRLPCRSLDATALRQPLTAVPAKYISDYAAQRPLRVLPGYQYEQFSAQAQQCFFGEPYRVGVDSDRMGVRLSGPALAYEGPAVMSQGIAYGAIQVPADGQPIVLLNDRQTLGGYPVLGALLPLDAFLLGQMPPGRELRFEPITLDAATALMQVYYGFFG